MSLPLFFSGLFLLALYFFIALFKKEKVDSQALNSNPFTPPNSIQQVLKARAKDFHPIPFSQNPWNSPEFSKRYTHYVDQQKIWGEGDEDVARLITLFSGQVLNILDIGCGTGRHSLKLAQKGHFVTGIDSCAEAILLAKQRSDQMNLFFLQTDFLSFCAKEPFDFILILCSLILNVPSELFLDWISKAFELLKPKGTLVIELPATLPISDENFLLDNRPFWSEENCWVYHRCEVFQEKRIVLDSFLCCGMEAEELPSNSVTRHYYQEKDFRMALPEEAQIIWSLPQTKAQKHPWLLIQKKE